MSQSATSVTVRLFDADDSGFVCPMALTLKLGTCTSSGSAPPVTPTAAVPGLSIAWYSPCPSSGPVSDFTLALTLMAGDACLDALFCSTNDTLIKLPLTSPEPTTRSVSSPLSRDHHPVDPTTAPLLPAPPHIVVSASSPSAVNDPVSPLTVTLEPAAKWQSGASVTVSLLDADASGLVCPMRLVLNPGTCTSSGAAPPSTPSRSSVALPIACGTPSPPYRPSAASTDASMLIEGDVW